MAMAAAVDGGAAKDFNDLKCQFRTREGFYRLLAGPESRRVSAGVPAGHIPSSNAVTGSGGGPGTGMIGSSGPGSGTLPPVRLSLVRLLQADEEPLRDEPDRICFNLGRELYFYSCQGTRRALDLNKPIDKRIYKGTQPTCHNFNQFNASSESISLLVGFSAGQVQYLDLIKKETSKLFNEENASAPNGSSPSGTVV